VAALAVLLGLCLVIGRRFLGEAAACLATTACALDPNLIANGAVATVDMIYALADPPDPGRRAAGWPRSRRSRGAGGREPPSAWPSPRSSRFLLVPAVFLFPLLIAAPAAAPHQRARGRGRGGRGPCPAGP
jgi:hypothetical protein